MLFKKQSRHFLIFAFSFIILLVQSVHSQDSLEASPGPVNYGSLPLSRELEPTLNPFGTAGMSNVISAEPLGAGRLGMTLRANFYQQAKAGPGTPIKDAQITTITFGAALGINPYIDGFVGADAYSLRGTGVSSSGLGTSFLGAQGTLPLPENVPVRLGLQLVSLFGTSNNAINTSLAPSGDQGAYGYNYLETRKFTDLMARATQSLIFAGENMGVKFHLNEGVISSFQPDKRILLVTGAGVQFTVMPPLVLGVEINDRTFIQDIRMSDPLWVTPSIVIRTPAHVNITGGADISLSEDRADGTRTLEPWRGFFGASISFDTQKEMRRQQAEAAKRERMEKERLVRVARQAEITRDSLARANAEEKARQQAIADSIASKARQDSLDQAARLASAQSNLANTRSNLDATQRALKEERSKRSEAEKQLLTTGMLLLDAVYFETGKTEISINSKPYLNIIAKMLTKYPKLQIEVAGHTDNVGGYEYNMGLSQGRSEAVMNYMQMVEPALQGHLTAVGYGYNKPKASNNTADGRKFNRRTELQVTNKEVLREYNP